MPKLLKPAEVAEMLGQSTDTIWRWCKSGRLPCVKISPRNTRIKSEEVEKFINTHSTRGLA